MLHLKCWNWQEGRKSGPLNLWQDLDRDGISHVHMHDAPEMALANPLKLVKTLFGTTPLAITVDNIKPKVSKNGFQAYAYSNLDAKLHIDQYMYLSPAIQLLVCVKPASDGGGENYFVDTWKILKKLKKTDRDLYDGLFEVPRIIGYPNLIWPAPTFSLRCGNLVCLHGPSISDQDIVGDRFEHELSKAPKTYVKLERGNISINCNQRSFHARTAFKDKTRHLVRILVWFQKPMWAPKEFINKATPIAMHTEKFAQHQPLWVRKRLGYSGKMSGFKNYSLSDIKAQIRGKPYRAGLEPQGEKLIRIYSEINDYPELLDEWKSLF